MVDDKMEIVIVGQWAILKLLQYTNAHVITERHIPDFQRLPIECVGKLNIYFTTLH